MHERQKLEWQKIEGKVQGVNTIEITTENIFDSEWSPEVPITHVMKNGVDISVDLKPLISPLGNFGETLYREGEFKEIQDNLSRYWSFSERPKLFTDVLSVGDETIQLRSKYAKSARMEKHMLKLNKIIEGINGSFPYKRAVIGNDGERLEIQFLNTDARKTLQKGGDVDCGLFLSVNGHLRVAAGINQLVCTNGLTETMTVWSGREFNFGPEFIERAGKLADWLSSQVDKKVDSVREISIAFDGYPESLFKNFWKPWAEQIALKTLTWYDVIYAVTEEVNQKLTPVRYKVLELRSQVDKVQADSCKCPTCSAEV